MLFRSVPSRFKVVGVLLIFGVAAALIWVRLDRASTANQSAKNETPDSAEWRRLLENPQVKPGSLPAIRLLNSIPANAEEVARIKRHIANLANIEKPDFGLSGTMGGMAFAPVAGSEKAIGGMLLTNHQLQRSDDFRQLVGLGPRALP